jgi:hypothetical protein
MALGILLIAAGIALAEREGGYRFLLTGTEGTAIVVVIGPQTGADEADGTHDGCIAGAVSGKEIETTGVTFTESEAGYLCADVTAQEKDPENPTNPNRETFTFRFAIDPSDANNDSDDVAGVVRGSGNPTGNQLLVH